RPHPVAVGQRGCVPGRHPSGGRSIAVAERMFGLETEYAFSVLGRRGATPDKRAALGQLFEVAKRRLPNLPGMHSSGIFLVNGARFYLDCGSHPELTTPEVLNPWDACRYILAGERILGGLAQNLAAEDPAIAQATFARTSVC